MSGVETWLMVIAVFLSIKSVTIFALLPKSDFAVIVEPVFAMKLWWWSREGCLLSVLWRSHCLHFPELGRKTESEYYVAVLYEYSILNFVEYIHNWYLICCSKHPFWQSLCYDSYDNLDNSHSKWALANDWQFDT